MTDAGHYFLYALLLTAIAALGVALFRLKKVSEEREEDLMSLLIALSSLVEMRDAYTQGHCVRVRHLVAEMGVKLNLGKKQMEDIIIAATLHDIGKLGVPDGILLKPGRLSADEFEFIKGHVIFGSSALSTIKRFQNVVNIIRHHHEAYDGGGYPDGLKGDLIPLGSQIIAVLDAYDAMTSDRVYRHAYTAEMAAAILAEGSGRQFDPEIVELFIKLLKERPHTGIDPVCGMPADGSRQYRHDGKDFFFCSQACLDEFKKDPDKYAREALPGIRL